ncbi:MAG: DNA polymerase III subunit gamma/tau [Candidatus Puniceispirillum sp.]
MNETATTAYRVLARKYRPETFSALIGQDALVRTLGNALSLGRLAHAFVLTGVRGVGKTSTARLLAKGLNCIGADGKGEATLEPCGICESCTAIAAGRHVDVLEIDAASHTGVDDAREIIEAVNYRPVSARYKIYIIDEVHMMSKSAFNALLKTLEEPPDAVKFIFATTEIRKVPVTILSRCQRYDLRRVPASMLASHLEMICTKENIKADAGALAAIASAAEGSVRDALSLLDQAAAMTADTLSAESVADMLGRPGRAEALDLLKSVLANDIASALASFNDIYQRGAEPEMLIADLLDIVHSASLCATGGSSATLIEGERAPIEELAALGIAKLGRAWQILLKGHGELNAAPNPATACEMLLIRLAHAAQMPSPDEILRALPDITANATDGTTDGTSAGTPQELPASTPTNQQASAPSSSSTPPPAAMQASASDTMSASGAMSAAPSTSAAIEQQPEQQSWPARDINTETAADSPEAPTTIQLNTLADIAALAEEKGEMLLAALIRNHVRLVALQPGLLEIALSGKPPEKFLGDLAQHLRHWTGARWLVSLSDEPAGKTLAEAKADAAAERLDAIAKTPLVAKITSVFPGATIEDITAIDAPVNELGKDTDAYDEEDTD